MHSNSYRHPKPGFLGRALAGLINHTGWARTRRALMARLPFMQLASDVRDVAYVTWLLPIEAAQTLLPAHLAGMQLWQRQGLTPFTVLSYQHRHFGPSALRGLRRLFPSPLQSNWRLYLGAGPAHTPDTRTVLFLKNIMDSTLFTLATRLFSDALPTHLPARFLHERSDDVLYTHIAPGAGSAPALEARLQIAVPGDPQAKQLPAAFADLFGSWDKAVRFLALQDAAVAPCIGTEPAQLTFAEIDLPIDVTQVLPARALDKVHCGLLADLPAGQQTSPTFCFVVPAGPFRVLSECVLPPSAP